MTMKFFQRRLNRSNVDPPNENGATTIPALTPKQLRLRKVQIYEEKQKKEREEKKRLVQEQQNKLIISAKDEPNGNNTTTTTTDRSLFVDDSTAQNSAGNSDTDDYDDTENNGPTVNTNDDNNNNNEPSSDSNQPPVSPISLLSFNTKPALIHPPRSLQGRQQEPVENGESEETNTKTTTATPQCGLLCGCI